MHEYSVASALRRMVEERAREERASRVLRVVVRIGEAAGVEIPLLVTAWDVVRRDGPCDGAPLEVVAVPARWVCPLCRAAVATPGALRCAACDVGAVMDGGDDLLLERIEIEREDAVPPGPDARRPG